MYQNVLTVDQQIRYQVVNTDFPMEQNNVFTTDQLYIFFEATYTTDVDPLALMNSSGAALITPIDHTQTIGFPISFPTD